MGATVLSGSGLPSGLTALLFFNVDRKEDMTLYSSTGACSYLLYLSCGARRKPPLDSLMTALLAEACFH